MVYRYTSPVYGEMRIVTNSRARNIIGRMRDGMVRLTVPPGTKVEAIERALRNIVPRLNGRVCEEGNLYDSLSPVVLDHYAFIFSRQSRDPHSIIFSHGEHEASLGVGDAIDPSDPMGRKLISDVMCAIASKRAGQLMIPRARAIAASLGLTPSGFSMSHGRARLGTCDSRRHIRFSYYNFFLPEDLRDYIICHELAHLTHMNHSKVFHNLCDSYLGGREARLIASLRRYRWPVLR